MVYDYVIVGSGFGGSVSALRLSEKGYKVAVVEQGRWMNSSDFSAAADSVKNLLWSPALGTRGYFFQEFFKHIAIVGGVGVGGGSLVYAAVLLKPKDAFYSDPAWNHLGVDWKSELKTHYRTASQMLGVETNPHFDTQDEYLKKTAELMNAKESFSQVPSGIYFGTPEKKERDPYFDGRGPDRSGCCLCGECLTGCRHGSKNSLDKNYLWLAQKNGVEIITGRKAENIIPMEGGGYTLEVCNPHKKRRKFPSIAAKNIVLSGGVLGTLDLLFRCRDVTRTLPELSPRLGTLVRTNSEAIVGVLDTKPDIDLTFGTAISTEFYPDSQTHITQNRFPRGYNFMRWFQGPLVDDSRPLRRAVKTLLQFLTHPAGSTAAIRCRDFHKRVTVLTVMQNLDNQLAFNYGRSIMEKFGYRLKSLKVPGKEAPSNLTVANQAAQAMAKATGGIGLNTLSESMGNLSTTAHILGGCHIGQDRSQGVINSDHQIFGYPGLFVADASAIPANVGVNPSLTVTALAERAMSKIPAKQEKESSNDNASSNNSAS